MLLFKKISLKIKDFFGGYDTAPIFALPINEGSIAQLV
jgi:hypothetical protein